MRNKFKNTVSCRRYIYFPYVYITSCLLQLSLVSFDAAQHNLVNVIKLLLCGKFITRGNNLAVVSGDQHIQIGEVCKRLMVLLLNLYYYRLTGIIHHGDTLHTEACYTTYSTFSSSQFRSKTYMEIFS